MEREGRAHEYKWVLGVEVEAQLLGYKLELVAEVPVQAHGCKWSVAEVAEEVMAGGQYEEARYVESAWSVRENVHEQWED